MEHYGRRKVLQGMAVLAGTAVLGTGVAQAAADPRQRFLKLIPAGDGVIYGLQADGALLWFRHTGWRTGTATWSPGVGRQIGDGFHQFADVLAAQDGRIFCRTGDGRMVSYRYAVTNPATGEGRWLDGAGTQIGSGFQRFPRIFGGWDGVLYCQDADGGLWRYQHTGSGWVNGNGELIGTGFKPYQTLTAGPDGVILGVIQGGWLHWWRYRDETRAWDNGGNPLSIGSGWGEGFHKQVLSDNEGCVYGVAVDSTPTPGNDDTLNWYRLTNARTVAADGVATWYDGGGPKAVGNGFSVEPTGALQGYASTLSVRAGQRIGFPVSTSLTGVTASVVRLNGAQERVWGPSPVSVGLQSLPATYRTSGCGWSERVSLTAPAGSGVYALELASPGGLRRHVPFVVKPVAPSARVAFLMPTNTYNAYNNWGGHNQYTPGEEDRQRKVTFLRPSTATQVEPTGRIDHLLYSDLFLLRWMDSERIAYDCYVDGDLDADGGWLSRYEALVLGSHPEYWTERMRSRVVSYLDSGGHLIYTGGNGLYERMSYADPTTALHRDRTGGRDEYHAVGMSESQITGVELSVDAYMDFYPYRVVSDHPLLAGTGLEVNDQFGAVAYNGCASGWEVDRLPGGSSGAQHIARGLNPAGGADMVLVPKPNGGWVFSASSMSFNGALPYDAAIRQILRNVFANI
ncbi:hypothetical protein LFM09_42490 [Lentzea alba]|uniref:N,N-dimethylformamidase beta subunit family domain-containing protein n=1 Tax=Lentzea alba TaxID=2714351 RepID=UPI0039BF512B